MWSMPPKGGTLNLSSARVALPLFGQQLSEFLDPGGIRSREVLGLVRILRNVIEFRTARPAKNELPVARDDRARSIHIPVDRPGGWCSFLLREERPDVLPLDLPLRRGGGAGQTEESGKPVEDAHRRLDHCGPETFLPVDECRDAD